MTVASEVAEGNAEEMSWMTLVQSDGERSGCRLGGDWTLISVGGGELGFSCFRWSRALASEPIIGAVAAWKRQQATVVRGNLGLAVRRVSLVRDHSLNHVVVFLGVPPRRSDQTTQRRQKKAKLRRVAKSKTLST